MLNLALVATLRAAGLAHIIDLMDIYTYPFKPSAERILFTENRHKWNPNTISLYILYFYNCMPAMLQCGGGGALDVNRQVLRHRFGRVMSHGGIYMRLGDAATAAAQNIRADGPEKYKLLRRRR